MARRRRAQRNPIGNSASIILAVLGAGAAAAVVYAIAKPATKTSGGINKPAPPTGPLLSLILTWNPIDSTAVPADVWQAISSYASFPYQGGGTIANQTPTAGTFVQPPTTLGAPPTITMPTNTIWVQCTYTPTGGAPTTYGAIVTGPTPAAVPGGPLLAAWTPGQVLTWYQLA
jgi:hypothetical protein